MKVSKVRRGQQMLRAATTVISLSLIFCSACNSASTGQSRSGTNDSGLRLTMTIVSQKSCESSADQYSEVLEISTRYSNQRKVPMGLWIGSDVPTLIRVARTVEEIKSGKYEVEGNGDVLPAGANGRYLLGEKVAGERLVALKPGQTVLGRNSIGIPVRKPNASTVQGTISTGIHFLQAGMLVRISGQDVRNQKESGSKNEVENFQWISVLSEPLQFEVRAEPLLQDCSVP